MSVCVIDCLILVVSVCVIASVCVIDCLILIVSVCVVDSYRVCLCDCAFNSDCEFYPVCL